MAQAPDWKQLIETGMQFTEMRRSQARRIAQELLAQGQIARDQLASTVDDLLELSRRRSEELRRVVRQEVQRQLGSIGLATKDDLERVERRLSGATASTARARKASAKGPAKKKTAAKKAPAKKSTGAKKTAKASTGGGRLSTDGASG
jgi:polyhydroxyalkanoate synthesis regulator phasin